jgi:uncharacterized protein
MRRQFANGFPSHATSFRASGLDVGDTTKLECAMREIHRRGAAVIWVNPLIGTRGYAPAARGMRAALPYIDAFIGGRDAEELAHISRHAASATR